MGSEKPVAPRVPDGGWGWVVTMGSFLVSALLFNQAACFGMIFSGYLVEEGASSVTTTWLYNSLMMIFHCTVLLDRPLASQFGWRSVAAVGVSLASASSFLSAFTHSPQFLFFSFSLLTGVGGGLAVGSALIVVAPYFNKRLGRATALQVAGSPLGQMVINPLLKYLLEEYGLRGTLIIFSAIALNAFVGVAVFHPVKWHMKRPRHSKTVVDDESESSEQIVLDNTEKNTDNSSACDIEALPYNKEQSRQSSDTYSECCVDTRSGYTTPSREHNTTPQAVRVPLVFLRILWSVAAKTISDLFILKQYRAIIIACSFMLSNVTYLNFVLLVPFIIRVKGLPFKMAVLCLSASGMANLVTRVALTSLTDCRWFRLRLSLLVGYSLKLLTFIVFATTVHPTLLVVAAGLFGTGLGASSSLITPAIIRHVGHALYPAMFGVTYFLMGLGCPLLGLLIGLARDLTQNYNSCLLLMAAMDVASFVLWLLMPAAISADAAKRDASETQLSN